jgi:hypothetical protein
MTRLRLFLLGNTGFIILVGLGLLRGLRGDIHPLYLVLLFFLCSSPVLLMRRLNDRYAPLAVFAVVYFVYFGALDVLRLLTGDPMPGPASGGIVSPAELAILVGCLLAQIGYLAGCRRNEDRRRPALRDWPEPALVLGGAALWMISTWLFWKFKIEIINDTTIEAVKRGLDSLNGLQVIGFLLAGYLQPLCIVILAYAQCRYRRAYMIPVLALVLGVQMVFGFVADIKGQVLLGFVLIALTKFLVDGRIPKLRVSFMAAMIIMIFPVLQANRMLRGDLDHAKAESNIVQTLQKAIETTGGANSGANRAQSFLERMSLKDNIDMIVARTGADVGYQNGHTIAPLLTVFIPRILWPAKPDVQTGQVLNKEFHLSEQVETYISPSHLGELYWNYGWSGVLVGMPLIGLILGLVGRQCDLSQGANLTRILILGATIQQLVLGFESAIVPQYSVWLRTLLAIGLLHWLLARAVDVRRSNAMPSAAPAARLFPHLMT